VNEVEMPRNVLWAAVSALAGSLTIRLIDYWRLRIERDFNATASGDDGAVLSYPWLAEHPIGIGIAVGLLVFAIGLYLIVGYAQTAYLRPEPPPATA